MTKKEWRADGYIHDEDDPPECYFCGKAAEYDDEIAETPWNGVYCCDELSCEGELAIMSKESYFTLVEVDDDD